MDERMRFIARLLDGESMSRLCEEFGISRKTGYKIWNRYQNTGAYALVDRSRKPHRFGNQLPEQLERTLLKLKREKPYWGAPKIRELLIRRFPNLRPHGRSRFWKRGSSRRGSQAGSTHPFFPPFPLALT